MSVEYFNALQRDFIGAGLTDEKPMEIGTIDELHAAMQDTARIGHSDRLPPPSFIPETPLGATVLELVNSGVQFSPLVRGVAGPEAEQSLLRNITYFDTLDPHTRSATIVTYNYNVVALISNRSPERLALALKTVENTGLIEGTLNRPTPPAPLKSWQDIPPKERATRISLDRIDEIPPPIRFSIFAVPAEERASLTARSALGHIALGTSMDAINEQVFKLLIGSEPL